MKETLQPGGSLWSRTAIAQTEYPPCQGDKEVDVTVVGAGFTGLRATLELLGKGANVALVDSHQPGWGASGRTGGQVNPMAHETPDQIRKKLGSKFGSRLTEAYIKSADELFQVIKKNDIDCEPVQRGWLRAAHCKKAIPALERMQQGWSREGLDVQMIHGDDLTRLSGSQAYDVAALTSAAGCIHPLSYCRGMAQRITQAGGAIHGNTQVTEVRREGDKWRVMSPKGSLLSRWVLFCTNGYTDNVLSGLKKTFIPLVSLQAATRPLSDELYQSILPEGHTLADTRRVIYYSRKDNRNRVLLGSLGRNPECTLDVDRKRLVKAFATVYPQLSVDDIEFYWGGRVAFTPDLLPHLHEPAPGILAGLGFNGRGVAMGSVMGRVMAERASGKDTEALDIPTTSFPRYPLRDMASLGIRLMIPYLETRDRVDIALS